MAASQASRVASESGFDQQQVLRDVLQKALTTIKKRELDQRNQNNQNHPDNELAANGTFITPHSYLFPSTFYIVYHL